MKHTKKKGANLLYTYLSLVFRDNGGQVSELTLVKDAV